MQLNLHTNFSGHINKLLSILTAVSIMWMLYLISKFTVHPLKIDGTNWKLILFVILLMPVNWILEALKIKRGELSQLRLLNLLTQIVKGIPINLISPFNFGQIIGRVHALTFSQSVAMIENNILASICQNLSHVIFGTLSLFYFTSQIPYFNLQNWTWLLYLLLILQFLLLVLFIVFFEKIKTMLYSKLEKFIQELENIRMQKMNLRDALYVFLLSCIRYGIYVIQFALILSLFTDASYYQLIPGICILYMIQSLIHLPVLINVMSRGFLAAWVFSYIQISNEQSQFASWIIFLINLGIPSIFACYFIWKDNKSLKYEKT